MNGAPKDDLCGMLGKNDSLDRIELTKPSTLYFSLPLTFGDVWRAMTGNPQ
jgi:hypothetical protein